MVRKKKAINRKSIRVKRERERGYTFQPDSIMESMRKWRIELKNGMSEWDFKCCMFREKIWRGGEGVLVTWDATDWQRGNLSSWGVYMYIYIYIFVFVFVFVLIDEWAMHIETTNYIFFIFTRGLLLHRLLIITSGDWGRWGFVTLCVIVNLRNNLQKKKKKKIKNQQ